MSSLLKLCFFSSPRKPSVLIMWGFLQYGVCVFRKTGMSDQEHVDFSRRFGELDDIRPYLKDGRKPRYELVELFDAGNLDENNQVLDPNATRSHYNKVSEFIFLIGS